MLRFLVSQIRSFSLFCSIGTPASQTQFNTTLSIWGLINLIATSWDSNVCLKSYEAAEILKPSNNETVIKPQQFAIVTVLPAVRTPQVFPFTLAIPLYDFSRAEVAVNWNHWHCMRIWSYLYTSSPEKLHAGLSHQVGRAREMERVKKKGKRKTQAQAWRGSSRLASGMCLPGHQ